MPLENLLKEKQVIAVLCNQWGDSGKGKIVDLLAENVDIIARGTGGNNAGHTVIINGKERVYHLLPSGITYDAQGKINILGNGMVIDLKVLCSELDELSAAGGSYKNLLISKGAHVILHPHIQEDRSRNKSQSNGGIGSTGRGIGPCYAEKIARHGITIGDLFEKDKLIQNLRKLKSVHQGMPIDEEQIMTELQPYAERLQPFVRDTVTELHRARAAGKKILIEGAQGLLLSVEHGTYPYVTSSDCSLNGTASGVGLSARQVDLTFGLVKFPFMTRVGAGPFPTEFGGKESEVYCGLEEHTKRFELETYGVPYTCEENKVKYDPKSSRVKEMMNAVNPFIQGIGIRLSAGEYGATTGRPRRTGWTDAVAGRYAANINGPCVTVLTKPDVLAGIDQFKICFGYNDGQKVNTEFNREEKYLSNVDPVYKTYDGYGDINNVKTYAELPKSLQTAIEDFERFTESPVGIVSIGPERDKILVKN